MAERYPFRDYSISRSQVAPKKDYKEYKSDLRADFKGRCGYCNALEIDLVPFHIDHFVPKCRCSGPFEYLKTDYKNLILACPVCNRYKSDQFAGDLNTEPYTNNLFYNPMKEDFRLLFYRNKYGVICSDDSKGIDMVIRLRLYSSLHAIEWALERTNNYIRLINQINTKRNSKLFYLKHELLEIFYELNNWYLGCYRYLASQKADDN